MELFDVYPLFDIEPVSGRGNYVTDRAGNTYLDLYGGHAVISIGHTHPHYVRMLQEQVARLGFYSNSVQNPLQEELAAKLGELSGLGEYRLFLCNSGAEANENALKLASFHNGRSKVIAFRGGFHGRTSAAVNVTDNPSIQAPLNRLMSVEMHQWNDLAGVVSSLQQQDVCAVIIEGIQGIGGVHLPAEGFLSALSAACRENGTVLILDEIQSGYGRTGRFFAFQHEEVEPDLVTVAKGMGNGFPVGGVLIHPKFEARHGLLGTTFGGNHLACAAGIAVLDVLKSEELIDNAAATGRYLREKLAALEGGPEVRGRGLMIALQFPFSVAELRRQLLYEHRIFTGSASDPRVMRLLPPLGLSRQEADRFVTALEHLLVTTAQ